MMKKLIALVLVLAFAAPVLADDLIPAAFRGMPGSTYSEWTYDDPCGVYDYDPPDSYSFVTDPTAGDPYGPGAQEWAGDADPCTPDWWESWGGRDGIVNFRYGSWDLNNFVRPEPSAKDMWIQITYLTQSGEPQDPAWMDAGYSEEGVGGFWEGPLSEWTGPEPEWLETWDDGGTWGYWEGNTADLDPANPDPLETWEGVEVLVAPELENRQVLGDGWIHDVYSATLPMNPEWEFFQFGMGPSPIPTILIDQIVIETLCYVPEPATMVLLGLGSLLMIRRKR